jgi:hypothetical protein
MNAVLGFAQVLEHDRLTPDQHEMIGMIRSRGDIFWTSSVTFSTCPRSKPANCPPGAGGLYPSPLLERVGRMMSLFAHDKGLEFTIQRPPSHQGPDG